MKKNIKHSTQTNKNKEEIIKTNPHLDKMTSGEPLENNSCDNKIITSEDNSQEILENNSCDNKNLENLEINYFNKTEHSFNSEFNNKKIYKIINNINNVINYYNIHLSENDQDNDISKDQKLERQKEILKNILKKENLKSHFKFTNDKGIGRLYSPNGFQNLISHIRNYILCDICYDIDMKDCHINILHQYMKNKGYSNPLFDERVNDRDKFFKEYKTNKKDFMMILFKENYKTYNKVLKNIHQFIYSFLQDNLDKDITIKNCYDACKSVKKSNILGSTMSLFLQTIENYILNHAITYMNNNDIKIHTLMYDGLLIYKNDKISLDELNKYIYDNTKFKVSFVFKDIKNVFPEDIFDNKHELLGDEDTDYSDYILDKYKILRYNDTMYLYDIIKKIWDKNIYEHTITEELKNQGIKENKRLNNIFSCIKKNCINHDEKTLEFNDLKIYLPFKSKLFLINEKKFVDYEPEHCITTKLKYDVNFDELLKKEYISTITNNNIYYDPIQNMYVKNNIEKDSQTKDYDLYTVLYDILGDKLDFVIQLFARYISFDIDDQYLIFLSGSGLNGKSFLIERIKQAFEFMSKDGNPNKIYTNSLSGSEGHQTELLSFNNKKFINYPEPNSKKALDISFLKKISGQKNHEARGCGSSDIIDFYTKPAIVFQCNDFPTFDKEDQGLLRRLINIRFTSKFTNEKQDNIDDSIDPEFIDQYIKTKIFTEEEKQDLSYGLMEYLLYTYIHIVKNEPLIIPDKIKQDIPTLKTSKDTVFELLDEKITKEDLKKNNKCTKYILKTELKTLFINNKHLLTDIKLEDFLNHVELYTKQSLSKKQKIHINGIYNTYLCIRGYSLNE